MRIVFVNRFFHPDISATSQILTDLAFHLSSEFEVHVVTSRQRYDRPEERLPPRERVSGVSVHRIWTTHFGRGWLPGRALDYLTFYLAATLRLFVLVRRDDIVVALTDPPIVSLPAAIVARLKRAKLVNWVQDVFPETAAALGVSLLRGPMGRMAAWLRDRSLAAAAANVALGERMGALLISRGIAEHTLCVIHNWAPGSRIEPLAPEANSLRKEWNLGQRFVVGYSGNMGRAHDLDVIVEAARRLRGRKDIAFLFIGDGNQRSALMEAARAAALENVLFQPYQPRESLPQSLTAPDCHIVSLKPMLEGLVFPSKLYSSLAAGRPVVFLGARDAEICGLLREGDPCGICVESDDAAALCNAIVMLCDDPDTRSRMGKSGRGLFERRFDQSIALASWTALMARL